jgi:hypothetical protein
MATFNIAISFEVEVGTYDAAHEMAATILEEVDHFSAGTITGVVIDVEHASGDLDE